MGNALKGCMGGSKDDEKMKKKFILKDGPVQHREADKNRVSEEEMKQQKLNQESINLGNTRKRSKDKLQKLKPNAFN